MSGHKGHLEGVNIGAMSPETIGAHIVAVLRRMTSREARRHVDSDILLLAEDVLRRFDQAPNLEGQQEVISEFSAGVVQLVVALIVGTHEEFGVMLNHFLMEIHKARTKAAGDLRTVTDASQLGDIDLSKVKFKEE